MAATGDGCSTVGPQGAAWRAEGSTGTGARVCVTVGLDPLAAQPGTGAAASAEGSAVRPVRAAPMAAMVTSAMPSA